MEEAGVDPFTDPAQLLLADRPRHAILPGFEYSYVDESTHPPTLHSQIPDGFAGAPSDLDPARRDASAWIERLPVIQAFRTKVLGRRGRA